MKKRVFYPREKLKAIVVAEQTKESPRFGNAAQLYRELVIHSDDSSRPLKIEAFKGPFKPANVDLDPDGLPYSEFSETVSDHICAFLGLRTDAPVWRYESAELLQAALESQTNKPMKDYVVVESNPSQPLRNLASISVMMDPQQIPPVYEAEKPTQMLSSIRLGTSDHFAHEARIAVALKKVFIELELQNGSKLRRSVGFEQHWDASNLTGNPDFSATGQPPTVEYTIEATDGVLKGVIEPMLGELFGVNNGEIIKVSLKTKILDVGDISEDEAKRFDGLAEDNGEPITDLARRRILTRLASMELFGTETLGNGEVLLANHEIKLVRPDED